MTWLLLATGFMGALTLIFLVRRVYHWFEIIATVEVRFSPKGGCMDAVVRELKAARREILVQAYSFTADPITYALVEAKKRGVQVEILLDRSNEQESYSDLHILLEQGLTPLIDANHAIAHNKIIVIDKRTLVTGSYNFTNQAEHENAENLLVIKGHPELLQQYRQNFMNHKGHSKQPTLKAVPPHTGQRRAA
jgi:phosphatidylserine/phosphatidylglycerophosphate/cardiolipin synthase-like enzyme